MDLDEWEIIPDEGFLEIHNHGRQQYFSRTYIQDSSKTVFNNYFETPSSKFVETTEVPRLPKQLVPLPIQFQPDIHKVPFDHEVIVHIPAPFDQKMKSNPYTGGDQDSVSQVFFKKMKENEFVDMKIDSPRSGSRGMLPQIEAGKFQFEEKDDHQSTMETMNDKQEDDDELNGGDDDHGVQMWKWSFNGIGAICSFGVAAAATICIIILANGPNNRQHHRQNHPKLRFQIFTDEKRIKEVVHEASRLNGAMSAARGIPFARAHITFGGYYDGL